MTSQEEMASSMMIRTGVLILATPDPIPVVDEVIGVTLILGGVAWKLVDRLPSKQTGGITQPDIYVPPVTSATRMGGQVKKQIRSTSRKSHSRRKKYAYGKRKRY